MEVVILYDEKIDVCIVSNRKIENELIERLYASVPVNHLITDSETSPLGKAREKVISRVTTERFMFLDDDVYLPQNYYSDLMRHWGEKTGWLQGWAIPWRPKWLHDWEVSRFRRARSERKIAYNERGFCCASVILTEALRDWRSLPDLEYYEDLVMSNHAIKKGYEVVKTSVACEHRIQYDFWSHVEKGIKDNRSTRGLSNLKLIQYAGTTCMSGFKASLNMRNPAIAYNAIKYGGKYVEALHPANPPENRSLFQSKENSLHHILKMIENRTMLREYEAN